MGEAGKPLLASMYRQYLADKDSQAFAQRVIVHYLPGSLERLLMSNQREMRRAAALALGLVGDYRSNGVLGRALGDDDRTVRLLAETALRAVWCRDGRPANRKRLAAVMQFNSERQHREALASADELIARAPELAEAWNQRAIAQFGLQQYHAAIRDCQRAVQLNPFHFGALAGLGQCYLRLGNDLWALENFRRALAINGELDGVRSSIGMIERRLKKQSDS
ncbi:MAG TPA: tetratricopeptide repeat protein [Pirellulales bacterium]|nr:tetratricopeptide repeat protein [Pirellulales bacterium]